MAKVLVVDDSALMRKKLRELIQPLGHEVVIARDGGDALEKVRLHDPDVITLDINMPNVDGLTCLAALMAESPRPVLMFSSLTTQGASATIEAMALGAFDFVPKPGGTISLTIEEVEDEFRTKLDAALQASQKKRLGLPARKRSSPDLAGTSSLSRGDQPKPRWSAPDAGDISARKSLRSKDRGFGLTIFGVSTGGPRCLDVILPALPASYPDAVLVVQHMPGSFTGAFAERLGKSCALPVSEVRKATELRPGHVYVAMGGADMAVVERAGKVLAQPRPSDENFLWHPSVSVAVDSAMQHFPAETITGVMLTGMGYDGAREMAQLRASGGTVLAESEQTSVVWGMPGELVKLNGADHILNNTQVASKLVELRARGAGYGIA